MSVKAGVLPSLGDLALSGLPHHQDVNGALVVIESLTQVPFQISRVFYVQAPEGAVRGQHAHKTCAQFLTCLRGRIEVICDDGAGTASFTLDRPDVALLIPAGIWAEQQYRAHDSILMVLCNRPYDKDDYIRDYDVFKAYRASEHAPT